MYKKLTQSILIYGLGAGISQSVLIFLVPIYTEYFSKEDYGTLEVLQSGIILLMIFGLLQLESAVGRCYFEKTFKANKTRYISTAFWIIFILSSVLSLLFIVLSPLVSTFLFDTEKWTYTIIMALLTVPFATIFSFFTVLVRYEEKPIFYSITTLLQVLITIGVAIWMIIIEKAGIVGVFYGQILGFFIGAIMYYIYFKKNIKFSIDKAIYKKYFDFSLPMIPGVLGNWANNHFNRFLMLNILTIGQIGVYVAVYKIASVFKLVEMAFKMAWQPFFIEQYTSNPNHKEVYKKISFAVTIIIVVMVLITFLIAKPIVELFTAPEYYHGYKILGILGISFGIVIIASTLNLSPILKKKTKFNTYSAFISVFFNFIFLYLLAPKYGIYGVACSFLIGNVALLISGFYFSEKLYPIFTKSSFVKRK